MSGAIPLSELSDAFVEALGGRRVRAALFTTFSFDPAFFELQILPLLFDRAFSQVDKIARAQLEDALREIDHLAVVYDRSALAQDAAPAFLDVRRIDVRHPTGAFHPKVALVLVDEPPDPTTGEEVQALVVGILSANLTRAGWWENVEVAHFDEIKDRRVTSRRRESFRRDLLGLLRRIQDAAEGEPIGALDQIRGFLRDRTLRRTPKNVSAAGHWHARVWSGSTSLPDFLRELKLQYWNFHLEVVSPYFDERDVGTLERIVEATRPVDVRVFLPTGPDGAALVSPEQYEAVAAIASWSRLPSEVVGRQGAVAGMADRRVHAKVYRFWSRDAGDVMLVGSPNLTGPGHQGRGGNLEAAFFVDVGEEGNARASWLRPLDAAPTTFASREAEEETVAVPIDLTLRYDWSEGALDWWYEGRDAVSLALHDPTGLPLGVIDARPAARWVRADLDLTLPVRDMLARTSFVEVRHQGRAWRVLVREEGMAYKPSLLVQLTPEEILRYWSQLSAEQRTALIEIYSDSKGSGVLLEGLPISSAPRNPETDSIFNRFAGLFHAFGRLREGIDLALTTGHEGDAEARLFGAKFDSLPVYLERMSESDTSDPVQRYVAFLCATQLVLRVRDRWPEFVRARQGHLQHLEALLARVDAARADLGLDHDEAFLDWYEEQFLKWVRPPQEADA